MDFARMNAFFRNLNHRIIFLYPKIVMLGEKTVLIAKPNAVNNDFLIFGGHFGFWSPSWISGKISDGPKAFFNQHG